MPCPNQKGMSKVPVGGISSNEGAAPQPVRGADLHLIAYIRTLTSLHINVSKGFQRSKHTNHIGRGNKVFLSNNNVTKSKYSAKHLHQKSDTEIQRFKKLAFMFGLLSLSKWQLSYIGRQIKHAL